MCSSDLLRSTLGAPYEFLWANPYHPGLSYYLAPLVFHDEDFGRLFIRSSWDESARWLGYFDGELQLFENGNVTHAESGDRIGDDAVVHIVKYCNGVETGSYKFLPGESASTRTVLRSATELMLEALRELDEAAQDNGDGGFR